MNHVCLNIRCGDVGLLGLVAEGKVPRIRFAVGHAPAAVGFPVFALVGAVVSVKVMEITVVWAICCVFGGSQTGREAPELCQKQG